MHIFHCLVFVYVQRLQHLPTISGNLKTNCTCTNLTELNLNKFEKYYCYESTSCDGVILEEFQSINSNLDLTRHIFSSFNVCTPDNYRENLFCLHKKTASITKSRLMVTTYTILDKNYTKLIFPNCSLDSNFTEEEWDNQTKTKERCLFLIGDLYSQDNVTFTDLLKNIFCLLTSMHQFETLLPDIEAFIANLIGTNEYRNVKPIYKKSVHSEYLINTLSVRPDFILFHIRRTFVIWRLDLSKSRPFCLSKINATHARRKSRYKRKTSRIMNQKSKRYFVENCPRLCACYVEKTDKIVIAVECADKHLDVAPTTIPFGTMIVELQNNNIHSLSNTNKFWWQKVIHLDIRRNKFKSLEYQHLPPKVTTLLLSSNNLNDLPLLLRKKIDKSPMFSISLAENKWNCSCKYFAVLQWIKTNSPKIIDYNFVFCVWSDGSTSLIKDVPIRFYCSQMIFPLLQIVQYFVNLAMLYAPIAVLIMAVYIRRLLIFSVLYQYHLYPSFLDRTIPGDKTKIYDLFACYHVKDRETVSLVRGVLGPWHHTCIQEHGWLPKINAERDLLFRFYSSKRTLVFVSRRFAKSAWFQTQFLKLYTTDLRHDLNRLVIILVKEPGRDYYLKTMVQRFYPAKYLLIWGEKWFWQKLRFVLRNTARGSNF